MTIDGEGRTPSLNTSTQLKGLCWKMCTVLGWVVVTAVVQKLPSSVFTLPSLCRQNQCSLQPWGSYERKCFFVNHTQSLSVGMNWAGVPPIFKIPIETEQLNRTNENGVVKWYRLLSSKARIPTTEGLREILWKNRSRWWELVLKTRALSKRLRKLIKPINGVMMFGSVNYRHNVM